MLLDLPKNRVCDVDMKLILIKNVSIFMNSCSIDRYSAVPSGFFFEKKVLSEDI